MHFRENILLYTLIPLIVLASTASYYRFMVIHDYIVSYEGTCDPALESCFVGCEDDECTDEYYYTRVERYAANLINFCGNDITDCEEANSCTSGENDCSITYCDPVTDLDQCDDVDESLNSIELLSPEIIGGDENETGVDNL